MKMTANMKMVLTVLVKDFNGSAFARQVFDKMVANGVKNTFNSVNATLASLAGKSIVDKRKDVLVDKMLTRYTVKDGVDVDALVADAQ